MMLANKLLSAMAGGAEEKLYSDDVFSTWTYSGTGATQTIANGIDLAGKGGMVWVKSRQYNASNYLIDTAMGGSQYLISNNTGNQNEITPAMQFNSNGYVDPGFFTSGTQVGWTFRRSPKFFDIVTYTGNGVAGRQIPHSLACEVGMILTKATSTTGDWNTYHRSATGDLVLNTNAAQTGSKSIISAASTTTFTVNGVANTNGVAYVAYLYAHDTSADGIVQCGSFTTDGSGNATVNHGWTAGVQFAMIKASSTTGDWEMFDTARTTGWAGSDARLRANLSSAEDAVTRLSAAGTSVSFAGLAATTTYIYSMIVATT